MSPATTKSTTNQKTIYLIRHAESEENRRLGSLKTAFTGLTKCMLPKKNDIYASLELLNVSSFLTCWGVFRIGCIRKKTQSNYL